VRDGEQIAVLDNGRLAELGNHEELLDEGGQYAAMIDAQNGRTLGEPVISDERAPETPLISGVSTSELP
jgi:ATP-binding cassette subfamily B protein